MLIRCQCDTIISQDACAESPSAPVLPSFSCFGYSHPDLQVQKILISETDDCGHLRRTDSRDQQTRMTWTSRQTSVRDGLALPSLHACSEFDELDDESEEDSFTRLTEMYKEFTLDLYAGTFVTQLISTGDYGETHCQLMEDLMTLKLDQRNGCIVEFPLTCVTKMYRAIRCDRKLFKPGPSVPEKLPSNARHIVIMCFHQRHQLVFVFTGLEETKRFITCMELLVRTAKRYSEDTLGETPTPAHSEDTAKASSRPIGVIPV